MLIGYFTGSAILFHGAERDTWKKPESITYYSLKNNTNTWLITQQQTQHITYIIKFQAQLCQITPNVLK